MTLFTGARFFVSDQLPRCGDCGDHMVVAAPSEDKADQVALCIACGMKQPYPFPLDKSTDVTMPGPPTAKDMIEYFQLTPDIAIRYWPKEVDQHWWVRNL